MRTLEPTVLQTYGNLTAQRSVEKEPADAACWNWALYGSRPLPVAHPNILFAYVSRDTSTTARADAQHTLDTSADGVWTNLKTGQPLRTLLDQYRAAYDKGNDDEASRNRVRDEVFELTLRAAGFEIATAVTPYLIGMIEPKDVVMWDHWWLEINGAVVETVTGHQLHAYSNQYLAPAFNFPRNRVANKTKLMPQLQGRVHARYVTSLQDHQAGYLDLLAG